MIDSHFVFEMGETEKYFKTNSDEGLDFYFKTSRNQ